MARVAVVIPNWNGRALLAGLLPTLAVQTYRDFRTLVIDNGSRDGTPEWLAGEWPAVEVLALERNIGFAPAVNLGIDAGDEEYLALLNNDMELDPGWLDALVRALDADPSAGAATPKQRSAHDRARLDGAGDGIAWTGGVTRRGIGELDRGQYDRGGHVFSASAGAALYRRAALRAVGPFDASFFAYLEDVDWGFRAQLAGWSARYVPEAVVYHHGGATGQATPARERELVARNHVAFVLKNFPARWLVRFAPLIVAELMRTLLVAARDGQAGAVLRGWREAARRLPATLRARRQVQATRTVPLAELEVAVFGARRRTADLLSVRPSEQAAS
jgi:GT2 family glycosyltransferase